MNVAQSLQRPGSIRALMVWIGGALGLVALLYLCVLGHFRIALTCSIFALLVGISLVRADVGLFASIIFLGVLGEFRRLLIFLDGWPQFDTLLVIGALMAILFVASAAAKREIVFDTWAAKIAALLIGVMAIQIFNPAQGGLVVGISGAMFYMTPLLWFFAGRTYLSPQMLETLFFKILMPLGLAATALGLYQTFVGYMPHQMAWYNVAGYGSLGPLFALKPLSFFSSSTEHATFLAVMIVVLFCAGVKGQRSAFVIAGLMFVSVFLVGSRGPVVRIVFTLACLWAVLSPTKSVWVLRGVIGLVIGFAGLYWSSTQVSKLDTDGAVGFYVERQTSAFMNPLDKKESSAQLHGVMFVNGIKRGVTTPLGFGLGATTKAAVKFGAEGHSSEVDLSNVFLSTGIVGGLLYAALLIIIAWTAVFCWQHDRTLFMLCVVGALIVTVGGYLHGGRYFLSTVMWVVIGAADRRYAEIRRTQAQ